MSHHLDVLDLACICVQIDEAPVEVRYRVELQLLHHEIESIEDIVVGLEHEGQRGVRLVCPGEERHDLVREMVVVIRCIDDYNVSMVSLLELERLVDLARALRSCTIRSSSATTSSFAS